MSKTPRLSDWRAAESTLLSQKEKRGVANIVPVPRSTGVGVEDGRIVWKRGREVYRKKGEWWGT